MIERMAEEPAISLGRVAQFKRKLWIRKHAARGWFDPAAQSGSTGLFIGGCGRSGTTVFKEMLQRHPAVACGPEASFFGIKFYPANISNRWPFSFAEIDAWVNRTSSVVQFADEFLTHYAKEQGKTLWADKTPNNVRATGRILHSFPNGRFIHVLRDARDVVCSLRTHPKEQIIKGRVTPVKTNKPIALCARRWAQDVACGLPYRGHPRYMEVRYEELVGEPAEAMKRVCDFLQLDYADELINPTNDSEKRRADVLNNSGATGKLTNVRVGRWRKDLSPRERMVTAATCGELMIATGYSADNTWVSEEAGAC